jgi:hypothetical protein
MTPDKVRGRRHHWQSPQRTRFYLCKLARATMPIAARLMRQPARRHVSMRSAASVKK